MLNKPSHTIRAFDEDLLDLFNTLSGIYLQDLALLNLLKHCFEQRQLLADLTTVEDTIKRIHKLRKTVDKKVVTLLALWQPKADDLRLVTASITLAQSLERLGEHLSNIHIKYLPTSSIPEQVDSFIVIINRLILMLQDALKALELMDETLLSPIKLADGEINNAYHALILSLQDNIMKDVANTPRYISLIFAAKSLERVGDYTSSIAKTIHYIISGKRKLPRSNYD